MPETRTRIDQMESPNGTLMLGKDH
jgi:hypothetical protein